MKIASSSVDMSVQHSATRLQAQRTSMRMWVGEDPAAALRRPPAIAAPGSPRSPDSHPVLERPKPPTPSTQPQAAAPDTTPPEDGDDALSPQLSMLRDLIERMTGVRLRTLHWPLGRDTPASTPVQPPPSGQSAQERPGWGAEFEHHEMLQEAESTQWTAQGIVRTADGQEIRFSMHVSMQRSYLETSSTTLRLGNAVQPTDPLVINFNGTAAQLQSSRFTFDLDSDGTPEQLPQLASGSGFLALDRNGNGRIDDGRELFGPTQGNGYAELAAHDQDGNGWIDENDAVYGQLGIWVPAADGGGQLTSLRDAGIGALSLQTVATPFALKDSRNQALGALRASSIYLREDGGVGSMQQLDLVA